MKRLLFILLAVSLVATGCASNSTPDTAAAPDAAETSEAMPDDMESTKASSEGDYEFSLVSPENLPMGDAEVAIAVKDAATGEPVTTDNLTVDVYMMPMDDMEKMTTESEVTAGAEPGTYNVKTYFSMAGPWVVHSVLNESGKEGAGRLLVEAQ